MENELTIIVKTFNRPDALVTLIKSIVRFYPGLTILVADDGDNCIDPQEVPSIQYFKIPYDSGLSYGRNFLLDKVETEFFLLLDDDFEFFEKTNIDILFHALKETAALDIVGGAVVNNGNEPIFYNNALKIEDGTLYHYRHQKTGELNGIPLFDIILNFFVGRTTRVREVKWDNDLKVIEHEDFFLRCKGNLKVGYIDKVIINHHPAKSDSEKRIFYTKVFWKKYGITSEVQVEGDLQWEHAHWADYEAVPVHAKNKL